MNVKINQSWKDVLQPEFDKPYFEELTKFVKKEYQEKTIFPPASRIFAAFNETPFESVKVIILGQDPYHGVAQANGLSFSVSDGIRTPPSLQNIYKEIQSDLKKNPPESGNLERWSRQGVLLLNATLTVESGKPGSHQNKGWEQFTDAVVKILNEKKQNVVFILWGAYAQKKGEHIDRAKHLVIESAHPSPFSADKGFFGSRPFSQTNAYLVMHDVEPIEW